MKKVVKFGGSSLASAQQFIKVGKIILADESRCYVVPSAPGKRFDGDTKVTDMLYQCYYSAANGEDYSGMLKQMADEEGDDQEFFDDLAMMVRARLVTQEVAKYFLEYRRKQADEKKKAGKRQK